MAKSGVAKSTEGCQDTEMTEMNKLLSQSTGKQHQQGEELEQQRMRGDLARFSVGIIGAVAYNVSIIAGIGCILLMDRPPPDFQLNTLRFSVGLMLASLYLLLTRRVPSIKRLNIKWLCFIAVVTVSYNFALYSHYLKNLTFVGILSLQSCFAVVFICILSRIFLQTDISGGKLAIIVVTLIGLGLTLVSQYDGILTCQYRIYHPKQQ